MTEDAQSRPFGRLREADDNPRAAWYRAVDAAREFDYGYATQNHRQRRNGNGNGLNGNGRSIAWQALLTVGIALLSGGIAGLGIFTWQGEQMLAPIREKIAAIEFRLTQIDRHIEATDSKVATKRDISDTIGFMTETNRQIAELRMELATKVDTETRREMLERLLASDAEIRQRLSRIEQSMDILRGLPNSGKGDRFSDPDMR